MGETAARPFEAEHAGLEIRRLLRAGDACGVAIEYGSLRALVACERKTQTI
jgi:hypothetical protein